MEGEVFLPLVAPSTGAMPVYFRKGFIVSFNPATGANVVRLSGQDIPNLPILISGSETAFQVGQTVGIMVVGTAMFIVGRIAIPGTPAYASTASAFATSTSYASNFALTSGFTGTVFASMPVPSWATKAAVVSIARGKAKNTTAAIAFLSTFAYIPGASTQAPNFMTVQPGDWNPLDAVNIGSVNVTPGGTLNTEVQLSTGGTPGWAADAANEIFHATMAIFTT